MPSGFDAVGDSCLGEELGCEMGDWELESCWLALEWSSTMEDCVRS